MSVDDIAARVMLKGRGALMAKFDLKEAYRQIPVHPDDCWMLGMEWKDSCLSAQHYPLASGQLR